MPGAVTIEGGKGGGLLSWRNRAGQGYQYEGWWFGEDTRDVRASMIVGKPRYPGDRKTCVVNVKFEPHTKYVVWINSKKFTGFKDVEGNSAVPYLLVFQTR